MSTKSLKFTVLLFVLLLAIVVPLHAASNGSISIDTARTPTGQTPRDCDDIHIEYHYKVTTDTDEVAAGIRSPSSRLMPMGKRWTPISLADGGIDAEDSNTVENLDPDGITARPITVALYDILDPGSIDPNSIEGHNFATSGSLLAKTVLDPRSS